jgi:hypothetical protein
MDEFTRKVSELDMLNTVGATEDTKINFINQNFPKLLEGSNVNLNIKTNAGEASKKMVELGKKISKRRKEGATETEVLREMALGLGTINAEHQGVEAVEEQLKDVRTQQTELRKIAGQKEVAEFKESLKEDKLSFTQTRGLIDEEGAYTLLINNQTGEREKLREATKGTGKKFKFVDKPLEGGFFQRVEIITDKEGNVTRENFGVPFEKRVDALGNLLAPPREIPIFNKEGRQIAGPPAPAKAKEAPSLEPAPEEAPVEEPPPPSGLPGSIAPGLPAKPTPAPELTSIPQAENFLPSGEQVSLVSIREPAIQEEVNEVRAQFTGTKGLANFIRAARATEVYKNDPRPVREKNNELVRIWAREFKEGRIPVGAIK